jgi:ABC-type glycerol-3-phosphate transport system substrate-binding protein
MDLQRKLSRRGVLRWFGLAGAAACLSACSPVRAPTRAAGDGEATSHETKVISISHIGGGSVEASEQSHRMKLLRAQFPEIEFENRWVGFSGYLEKIPLAIASNDLADLQFCNAYNDVPQMMENGLLLDTDALLDEFGRNI